MEELLLQVSALILYAVGLFSLLDALMPLDRVRVTETDETV